MSCTTHPHNILLQFAAETGIIGLIFIWNFNYLIVNFLKLLIDILEQKIKYIFFKLV